MLNDDFYRLIKYCIYHLESPDMPAKKDLFLMECEKQKVNPDLFCANVEEYIFDTKLATYTYNLFSEEKINESLK